MSASGVVFDVKQLSVFDGPGIRTTAFFKGCPLRCMWCHNPEGLSAAPQLMVSRNGCAHCGKCDAACPSPDHCTTCGACARVCPMGLRRICGTRHTAKSLAALLRKDAEYLAQNAGGYTFSGGEPLAQPVFLLELLARLRGSHRAIETCGFAPEATFEAVLSELDYVLMDLKLMDPALHRRYTGVDNALILANLRILQKSGLPFVIRVPVIPGVNDTPENYEATARALATPGNLQCVELLPYHQTAGAKYSMVGETYAPSFDPNRPPNLDLSAFERRGIPARAL